MKTASVIFIAGTRPELIKVFPVVRALTAEAPWIVPRVCMTRQHDGLVEPILRDFGFQPDLTLDERPAGDALPAEHARILRQTSALLAREPCDAVVVQGDTTSAFAGALAAFYERIPVAHIEAGLRTSNRYAPYPEEMNRRLTSVLAQLHFAPTERAAERLIQEGVAPEAVHVTGNPVIDIVLEIAAALPPAPQDDREARILVTLHRREIFGEPLTRICDALASVVEAFPHVQLVWPVHLNPRVREAVIPRFRDMARVHVMEPCGYREFVAQMKRATLILTDSGGVQEEAPALGVPVLVLREETERPEGVLAGACALVGLDADRIVASVSRLLRDPSARAAMNVGVSPYGDGQAAGRIARHLAALVAR